jgi:hypothetical protein
MLRSSAATKVFAFEPQLSETAALQRNAQMNGLAGDARLRVRNQFVGRADRQDVTSLDALDLDRRQRGFLKIDVDGAEMDVLLSGRRLLAEAPLDIMLETHSAELERDCRQLLAAAGFTCQVIPNAWWRIFVPELRPIAHNRWLWATKD